MSFSEFKNREYKKLAKLIRDNLDMKSLYAILNRDV